MASVRHRRRLTRFNRRFHASLYWLGWAILMGVLGGAWWLTLRWEGWLSENRFADPYAFIDAVYAGAAPTSYEAMLPDGNVAVIENRYARFRAAAPGDDVGEFLFPDFGAAIEHARRAELEILPSASMIHFLLKRENDGLLGRVHLDIHGQCVELLEEMLDLVNDKQSRVYLLAALKIADIPVEIDPTDSGDVEAMTERFESGTWHDTDTLTRGIDTARVPGRYQSDGALRNAFRLQRFLSGPIPPEARAGIVSILNRDEGIRSRLTGIMKVQAVIDNAPESEGIIAATDSSDVVPLLPPAQAPEHRLYRSLYGNYPMDDSTNWMGTIVESVRNGRLDLTPGPESGWYERRLYALVPLVKDSDAIELQRRKVRALPNYRRFQEETFRAALAGDRESHVMRILPPYFAKLVSDSERERPWITLSPRFSSEPVPVVYRRWALAYEWLAEQLPDHQEAILPLARLVNSLAAVSLLELGIPHDTLMERVIDQEEFLLSANEGWEWLSQATERAAGAGDPRFVVAVESRRSWGVIGVRLQQVEYTYESPPQVEGYRIRIAPAILYAPVLVAVEMRGQVSEEKFFAALEGQSRVSRALNTLQATPGRAQQELISLRSVLMGITLVVLLLLVIDTWRRHRRLARRPYDRRYRFFGAPMKPFGKPVSIRRRVYTILAVASLLIIIVCSIPFVVFLLLPRFDLPRWHLSFFSGTVAVAGARIVQLDSDGWRREPVLRRNLVVDLAASMALRSDSDAVRHHALNMWPYSSAFGQWTWDRVFELAEEGTRSEAELALMWITEGSFSEWGLYSSIDIADYIARAEAIMEGYGNPPSMVLPMAWTWRHLGRKEQVPTIRAALHLEDRQTTSYRNAIRSLFMLEDKYPAYDLLAEFGLVPTDPLDARMDRLPTIEECDAIGTVLYEWNWELQRRWNHEGQYYPANIRQMDARDRRWADYLLALIENPRRSPYKSTIISSVYRNLPEDTRLVVLMLAAERLGSGPDTMRPDVMVILLDRFVSEIASNHRDYARSVLTSLMASPEWRDTMLPCQSFTIFDDSTVGEFLEGVLDESRRDAEWSMDLLFEGFSD